MQFSQGDKVTVSRGKLRTQEVTIGAGPDAAGNYLVTDSEGLFHSIPAGSIKGRPEPTVTLSQVAEILHTHNVPGPVRQAFEPLLPGLSVELARRADFDAADEDDRAQEGF